jgi:hypothetical protein
LLLLDETDPGDSTYGFGPTGSLVLDDTYIYWRLLQGEDSQQELRRVEKKIDPFGAESVGERVTTVSSNASGFVVDAMSIYVSSPASLEVFPKTPSDYPASKRLFDGRVDALAVDATDVYFVKDGTLPSALARVPLAGGTPSELGALWCAKIALDADAVYCRTYEAVLRVPKTGEAPQPLIEASGHSMVLLGSKLYVDNAKAPGKLVVVPVDGGTVDPATAETIDLGTTKFEGLTGYDNALYFVRDGAAIARVPVDGGAPSEAKIAVFQNSPTDLVVDATGVYWADHWEGCVAQQRSRVTGPPPEYETDDIISCAKWSAETLILHLPAVF